MVFQHCLSRSFFMQSLYYYEPGEMLYLNNAKSGCTTIKAAMMTLMRQNEKLEFEEPISLEKVHGRGPWWSDNFHNISVEKTRSFSLVRNPFSRVLSAFLDKICKDNILRHQFYLQHGIEEGYQLTFTEFLRLLDPKKTIIDQHYNTQVNNILLGAVPINRIYYLEDFDSTAADLEAWLDNGITFKRRQEHATNASEKLMVHLTDEAHERIVSLYKADFETFGYSTDPTKLLQAPDLYYKPEPVKAKAMQAMRLLGMSRSNIPASEIVAAAQKMKLSLMERLLVADSIPGYPGLKDGFNALLGEAAFKGNPNDMFVALRYAVESARKDFSHEYRERALRALIYLAPYLPSFRVQLVQLLTQQRQHGQAAQEIENLRKTTWQAALVERLSQNLAASL